MANEQTRAPSRLPKIDNTAGHRYHLTEDPDLAGLVPTIWPFRAEWIEFVGQDGLAEWEEAMREKVGIDLDASRAKKGCATTSGSPGGWDDCDYWGNGC